MGRAEVYPKENIPTAGVDSVLAYYIPCEKKLISVLHNVM